MSSNSQAAVGLLNSNCYGIIRNGKFPSHGIFSERSVAFLFKICNLQNRNIQGIGRSRGGAAGAPPPPGSISFVFAYVFAEKCMCQRLAPPQREILDPPLIQGHTCSVVRRTKWSVFNGKISLVWSDGPQHKCHPDYRNSSCENVHLNALFVLFENFQFKKLNFATETLFPDG